MLPAIDAILGLFSKRARDIDLIDKTIEKLSQSDGEIERRLQALKAQVDVYQRSAGKEPPGGR
jgi:hypothetical protein